MLTGMQWYIVTGVLAGGLALFAILSPRKKQLKFAALVCTTMFLPLTYLAINDLLSRPKPLQIEVAKNHLNDSIVTASLMREDEAIYLWLQMPGIKEPRAYQLPWSEQMAIELHKAEREAEAEGTEVQMQLPEGDALNSDEPTFHATVHNPPPPKET
ncbi:MAG: hypothetical protein AB8B64_05925 [Granulosicoccus sp.]